MYVFCIVIRVAFKNDFTLIWDNFLQSALFVCFCVSGFRTQRALCTQCWWMTRSGQKSASLDTFRMYVDPELAWRQHLNVTLLHCCIYFLKHFLFCFVGVLLFCLQSYPEQSLLLVVTGALGLRVLHSPLLPILPVFNTFKVTSGSLVTSSSHVPFFPKRLRRCVNILTNFILYNFNNWSGKKVLPAWSCASLGQPVDSGVVLGVSGLRLGTSVFLLPGGDGGVGQKHRWACGGVSLSLL